MPTPPSKPTLWAPWRIEFMRQLNGNPGSAGAADGEDGRRCFLCEAAAPDATPEALTAQHVLYRTEHAVLMMNRYPYVNGHLLVAPAAHVTDLTELTAEARHAMSDLADLGARALQRALNCQGYNLGSNVGRCAGAAVPGHVHTHVVPRWHGDTNFMDVLGGVRVIPQALEDCYAEVNAAVAALL